MSCIEESSNSSIDNSFHEPLEQKCTLMNQISRRTLATKESMLSPDILNVELAELFAENVIAKICRVAIRLLEEQHGILNQYPESVPQRGDYTGRYEMRDAEFWTCGFFPGSMYAILERTIKYPGFLNVPESIHTHFQEDLMKLSRAWAEPLHAMASRTDTHDMGFIILPAIRRHWELTGDTKYLQSVLTAAESLASRFDEKVQAIRSWDFAINKRYRYVDKKVDFLVIIDSMCNLDLLYYAGHHTGNQKLIDIATTHARKVLQTIVRDDFSTFHLINFDAQTGEVKNKLTNQGYKDWSTWSRGQAWAILGFTQTYIWTKDPAFLNAAISLSDYFLSRLEASNLPSPYVPLWDFDAPVPLSPGELPLRDSSAGMIAANGLLLLHQMSNSQEKSSRFLSAAMKIANATIDLSLSREKAMFDPAATDLKVNDVSEGEHFDAILKNATACRNEDSFRQYWDHGLVYADYYFLEFGNEVLRMCLT